MTERLACKRGGGCPLPLLLPQNLPGTRQRQVDVRADVFFAQLVQHAGFFAEHVGLGVDARKDDCDSAAVAGLLGLLKGADSAGVQVNRVPHAQDQNLVADFGLFDGDVKFSHGAKKERAVDFVNHRALGNVQGLLVFGRAAYAFGQVFALGLNV